MAGLIGALSLPAARVRGRPSAASSAPPADEGTVTRAYDGDTLEVSGIGKVRLIGIDALDGHNTDRMAGQSRRYGLSVRDVQYWAGEATDFARRELEGRRVALTLGLKLHDEYGRVLAYVSLLREEAPQDFGLLMLRGGLAATYPNVRHALWEEYVRAEREAQSRRRGMWQDARLQP
ncbi:MAG: thermonuclease family protein [Planctomycetota bacterium]